MMARRARGGSDMIDAQLHGYRRGISCIRAAGVGVCLKESAWDRGVWHRFHIHTKEDESRQCDA